MQLKQYQKQSLEALEQFFSIASAIGAEQAFERTLQQQTMTIVPYNDRLNGIPSVCIRIPTGGGKTLLGCHSIPVAAGQYANTDSPIVLWVVPTDMIRVQTLGALNNLHHPYRQALHSYYGDRVKVCDLETLQTLNKHDIGKSCMVIVTTIQAFNIDKDKTHQRNAYAFDENLSEYFTGLTPSQTANLDKVTHDTLQYQPFLTQQDIGRVKHSLVNFFHLHRPIVIVDEAHKNRSKSVFATLQRLNPKCLIELTATPKDNNVIYSVSAAELKASEMIKLPVILTEHPNDWQACVRDALIQRQELELTAQKESDYVRPILLIQAQDKNGEANIPAVKQFLTDESHIEESWIAISTGDTKELDNIDLFSPDCPIRIVITVAALKEGWDCSFAYVLASLQNIQSAVDVEQLLGRVLRMPYAKLRKQNALNKAYAHVISDSTAKATDNLKDRMVENMGFNRWEAESAIVANPQHALPLTETDTTPTKPIEPQVLISVPFKVEVEQLPTELKSHVKTYETSQGTAVVIAQGVTDDKFDAIEQAVTQQANTPKHQTHVQTSFQEGRATRQAAIAPENWNKTFTPIPQLGLFVDGFWQLADKEAIEDSIEWNLLDFPISLEQFYIRETLNSFEIDMDSDTEKVTATHFDTKQLHFEAMPTTINEDDLVNWLDKKTRRNGVTQVQLRAYLLKLIRYLIHDRKFTLTSLHRAQFQLVQAVNQEIDRLFSLARKQAFQGDLFEHLKVNEDLTVYNSFEFKAGIYPTKKPYRGSWKFKKHFYAQVDDLNEKTSTGAFSEEFICARLLDMHPKVKYWVRNIPKQPQSSFWLPTEKDYFYPDFVAELEDGSIFVLEYKGGHLDTADDARIKNDIGKQWAKDSNGKRKFLMAKKQDEAGRSLEEQINAVIG